MRKQDVFCCSIGRLFSRWSGTIILLSLFLFGMQAEAQDRIVSGDKTVYTHEDLDNTFFQYQVYQFDQPEQMRMQLNAIADEEKQLRLQLGSEYDWALDLQDAEIFAPNFSFRVLTENGPVVTPYATDIAYKGTLQNEPESSVRMTITDDWMLGFVKSGDSKIFIEPLQRFVKNAPAGMHVIYNTKDVRPNPSLICGYDESEQRAPVITPDHVEPEVMAVDPVNCLEVETGLAGAYDMVVRYGTTQAVADYITGIMNVTQPLYDIFDLLYIIVEIVVPASEGADPWFLGQCMDNLLPSFVSWAPGGFAATHDVGQLWVARDVTKVDDGDCDDSGLIGRASGLGKVCTADRYNCCEDWSNTAAAQAHLSAHELGHTWDGSHGAAVNNDDIMWPNLDGDADEWSAANITRIQDHRDSRDCLAECCNPDDTDPIAECMDITVQLDVNGEASISAADIDNGSNDFCGSVTLALESDAVAFGCGDVGNNVVELTVEDESGNTATCDANVEVEDNVDPVAICQDITIYLDFEICTVSITADDVDNGSNDACGLEPLSIDIDFFDTGDVGDNTVTLTVTDVNGNSSSCESTVTVLKRPTTLENLGDFDGQYSDFPVLQAELLDELTGNPLVGRTITFELGPHTLFDVTDGSGIAEVTLRLGTEFLPTAIGGNYTIDVSYAGDDCYEPSDDSDVFTVLQEDARVTYTGKNFASTEAANSGEATLLLAATVCDITNTPEAAGDTDPGDISFATVTFVDRDNGNAPISPAIPVVIIGPDTTKGTVVFEWIVDIGLNDCQTFNIGIVVGNYYLRDDGADDQEIVICRPGNQFVTGGGYIILASSFGSLAGDNGTNCNFGYNSKFSGRNKEVGGEMNIIYRRTEVDGLHDYQIKSLEIASLGVDGDNDFAEFCGTAMLTDVTDEVVVVEEAMFILKMKDNGTPGTGVDLVGFALYANDGGLIFSSNWSGTETLQQLLDGGNVKVHSGGLNARDISNTSSLDDKIEAGILAEVYPNPFSERVQITFVLPEEGRTIVEVVSLSGEVMTSEDLGILNADNQYIWDFEASEKLSSGTYMYRIMSGENTLSGKLLYMK